MAVVYAERKRLRQIEAHEATGESVWIEDIPRPARVKIGTYWDMMTKSLVYGHDARFEKAMCLVMQFRMGIERPILASGAWLNIDDTDLSLSYLEAAIIAFKDVGARGVAEFEEWINDVFASHRIAFRMVDGEFVPITSDEMHVEVVEPALRLLIDSRFEAAHGAYLKALKEIGHDDAGDAITDAGTALQATLAALGCDGNTIGALWTDARRRNLVAPHDQNLINGIGKFIDWASADRSTTGDAHTHGAANRDDAWLMVHVVGALIVRLARGGTRGVIGIK